MTGVRNPSVRAEVGAPRQRERRSPASRTGGEARGHGPRVCTGTEAGGAPAGGPSLQGRWRFPPAPWAGPGQASGHSAPQPQGRHGL